MNDRGRAGEPSTASRDLDVGAYCRDVESYLCRRNGGHLVRIVGPSFVLVSGWAREGVPLKIVLRGIDRYLERRRERGAARRPARIEFCEHDVRAVFDEWRRAIGPLAHLLKDTGARESVGSARSGFDSPVERGFDAPAGSDCDSRVGSGFSRIAEGRAADGQPPGPGASRVQSGHAEDTGSIAGTREEYGAPAPRRSLPAHLERVHLRLSSLVASERLAPELLECIRALVAAIDEVRDRARHARGETRVAILDELRRRDAALGQVAWDTADAATIARLRGEASADLAGFRDRMAVATWNTAVDDAARRLLREELALPDVSLNG